MPWTLILHAGGVPLKTNQTVLLDLPAQHTGRTHLTRFLLRGSVFGNSIAFAGGEEQVRLQVVLLVVEFAVSAAASVEVVMTTTSHDLARLDDQDLIRATDGRKPVRDHERGAAFHQVLQA